MSDRELVSVIVPVFNGETHLAAALDSVLAQRVPLDLLVVDDGSTDGTSDVLRGFGDRVRSVRQEHSGAAAARNRGLALARGSLLAFLDADDLWTAGKLARQIETLRAVPNLEAVFGHMVEFYSDELTASERAALQCNSAPAPGYTAGTLLIRRAAFARVGPFSTEWRIGEFVDWYARATEARLRTALLPDIFLHRRLHRSNSGRRGEPSAVDYVRIARRALERRRPAGQPE